MITIARRKRKTKPPGLVDKLKDLVREDPRKALEFASLMGIGIGQARATSLGNPAHYGSLVADITKAMLPKFGGDIDLRGGLGSGAYLATWGAVQTVSLLGPVPLGIATLRMQRKVKELAMTGPDARYIQLVTVPATERQYIADVRTNYEGAGYGVREVPAVMNGEPAVRIEITVEKLTTEELLQRETSRDVFLMIGDASAVTYVCTQLPKIFAFGVGIFTKMYEEGLPGEFT